MATVSPFEHRVQLHRADLLAFLMRRAPGYAEELAQEVWIRISKASPDCPDERSFRAYMFTVARRLLIDHHRRRAARIQLVSLEGATVEQSAGSSAGPEMRVRASQLVDLVERTLEQMKPEIADVFRLRMTTGLSFKDIAERQGVPLNTALGRMHRATRQLAVVVREAGLANDDERGAQ